MPKLFTLGSSARQGGAFQSTFPPWDSSVLGCTTRTTVRTRPAQSTSRNPRCASASGTQARRLSLTSALVPQEEETLSWRPRNCSFRPRRDPPRPSVRPAARRLGSGGWGEGSQARGAAFSNSAGSRQSCARLRLVARGLADAQAVLKRLPSPELFPGFVPTLELLAAAGRDVAACVSISRAGPLHSPRSLCALLFHREAARFEIWAAGPPNGPDTTGVLSVSPDPGFGLRLGGSWAESVGGSVLRLFRLPAVSSPARAGAARLLEEVPPAT